MGVGSNHLEANALSAQSLDSGNGAIEVAGASNLMREISLHRADVYWTEASVYSHRFLRIQWPAIFAESFDTFP
jgi:hypothetical protein